MSNVRLESVRKVYDDGRVAVEGASFEVGAGELMVLVGPSGCGKSTLLRMIAGIEEITAGTLSIGGRVVNELAPKDRDIAMVFQNYALYPHMSVAENMGFGLRLARRPAAEIEQRVRAAAARLGLIELLPLRPRVLSGGQRQRVALGRALVREPKVFLLDEPLSNLDAKLRLAMRTEIARLQRELRATMIYVTHDQVEAMTLGHRIVVLEAGRVQQIDTPMGLYERPANLFVAGFLGSPAMNFVRGRVRRAPGLQLSFDGGVLPLGTAVPAAVAAGDGEWVAGLRPEHLHPADGSAAGAASSRITAQVELVEALGNEMILNLRCGGVDLVARVPPRDAPQPGQDIALAFDPARLLFFDPASGARVS